MCTIVLKEETLQNVFSIFLSINLHNYINICYCLYTNHLFPAPYLGTSDTHTCRRNGMRIAHPPLSTPSLWPLSSMSQVGNGIVQSLMNHCSVLTPCGITRILIYEVMLF